MSGTPATAARLLPALRWLRGYDRRLLTADLKAGVTVAVLLVPQSMAYATLAGMPPVAGLYAAMVSLVVYALLGTSNYISVAPVAIDSLLVATAVGPLAGGDVRRYVLLAGLLAVMTGLVQIVAGALRLGTLVGFVSAPVISGFTSAAALTIAASQLKDLAGLKVKGGGSATFVDTLRDLAPALPQAHLPTLALGLGCAGLLVALSRLAPRLPGALLVVGVAAGVVALAGLKGIALVGAVPAGLPTPRLPFPDLAAIRDLLPDALAIALISYMESISTASAFARSTRSRVDPNQELIAVGAANGVAGLFQGFSGAGGFSRGAVNLRAGARTPMSGVIAAVGLAVAVLAAAPVLALLPKVALAAIIIVAVASLVDVRGALAIGRIRRGDLLALAVTFVATLVLGVVPGIAVGVAASLAIFLRQTARPHLPELGRVPGTRLFRNVDRHDVQTDPLVAVLRIDAPLYFANSRATADTLTDLVASRPTLRYVVLDMSAVGGVDYTGAEALADLERELDQAGIGLHVATVRGPVRDVLERTRMWDTLARGCRIHPAVAEAVAALDLPPGSPIVPPAESLVPRPVDVP